jgi:hypothetical protein
MDERGVVVGIGIGIGIIIFSLLGRLYGGGVVFFTTGVNDDFLLQKFSL